jgi:hypothetical protein
LLVASLASGVGESGIYRGLPLNDFLFRLRRVNNSIQLVLPNINFRASATMIPIAIGAAIVQRFSAGDSVPILSINEQSKNC